MAELAILIPCLRRPHRVQPTLDSIRGSTPGAPRILFIADPKDKRQQKQLAQCGAEVMIQPGNYARKINAAIRHTEEPLLLFAADDLRFHRGWLEAAKAHLQGGVGVVATNDLCNGMVMEGRLATHPLTTRAYCERGSIDDPEVVLHEGYRHEFVDREFSETAMHRAAFAYAADSIVEHLHPQVGKAPMDGLYAQQRTRMKIGRRIYNRRKSLWT